LNANPIFITHQIICSGDYPNCRLPEIFNMKSIFTTVCFLLFFHLSFAQIPLTVLPSGGNKKAAVSEQIGLTKVTINYDRPGVKGREGKIWGQLVHIGYTDQGFGNTKQAPWRAGANENTTIEFSTDVKIEGKDLPAGKYGFFIAYDSNESTLIFSKNANSWGSYYYNDKEDALRVKVKPVALDKSVEWLKYEFSNETENSATISLQWEKLSIPFKVEVDYIKTQIQSFRNELRTEKGFIWQSWEQAAAWCLQRNVNLEEALMWADSASSGSFGGDKSFQALSTKAQILEKLGKSKEAAEVMKTALPLASMNEIHQYGRVLLGQKKNKEALEVFKTNFAKYPNQFTTLMGMTRGLSANGNYTEALKYANQALALAPDTNNKNNVSAMIDKLKANKDVN
jgi:tetratricopeptide (TPR) repeat protein